MRAGGLYLGGIGHPVSSSPNALVLLVSACVGLVCLCLCECVVCTCTCFCLGFCCGFFLFYFFLNKEERRCVYFWQRQKRSADIFLPVLLNWFFSDTENNINIPVDKTL